MRSVTGLALLILIASTASAGEVMADDWYALYIGDAKSGSMHFRTERLGEGAEARYVTDSLVVMTIARMGREITLRFEDRIEEDASGKVVSFRRRLDMGGGPTATSGTLETDGRIRVVASGRESHIAYPEGALGPAGVVRRLRAAGLTEGTRTTSTVFSLDFVGQEVIATAVVGKQEAVDVLGLEMRLHRTSTNLSVLPGFTTTSWVDADHRPHRIEQTLPGLGVMKMILTAEEVARRPGEPAEIFTTTLIRPDRAIPDPRQRTGRAVYRLRAASGTLGDVPRGCGQTVVRSEDGSLEVTVVVSAPHPASPITLPYPKEKAKGLLEAAPMVECDDPTVLKFAKEALGGTKDPIEAGRAIETFVRKRISNKSLDIAFASAAATAKSLEGDCSEHAVLCVAMARAVGLPSRVVLGLVYLPPGSAIGGETGIFGYHMWAEVLVGEGEWMAIDAAIGGMDRTHIALGRSDLVDVNPLVDLALPLLKIMGNLTIEVVATR